MLICFKFHNETGEKIKNFNKNSKYQHIVKFFYVLNNILLKPEFKN